MIKISPGLYQENLKIEFIYIKLSTFFTTYIYSKPSLRLEPKEKVGDIIILGNKGPVILIDLQK